MNAPIYIANTNLKEHFIVVSIGLLIILVITGYNNHDPLFLTELTLFLIAVVYLSFSQFLVKDLLLYDNYLIIKYILRPFGRIIRIDYNSIEQIVFRERMTARVQDRFFFKYKNGKSRRYRFDMNNNQYQKIFDVLRGKGIPIEVYSDTDLH